jgi:hypothetical protein
MKFRISTGAEGARKKAWRLKPGQFPGFPFPLMSIPTFLLNVSASLTETEATHLNEKIATARNDPILINHWLCRKS